MWVQAFLLKQINGRLYEIRRHFIKFALDDIRDAIGRDVLFGLKGYGRQTLTIYDLSKRETEIVFRILSREIDNCIVRAVQIRKDPAQEIPTTDNYITSHPTHTNKLEEVLRKMWIENKAGYFAGIENTPLPLRRYYD